MTSRFCAVLGLVLAWTASAVASPLPPKLPVSWSPPVSSHFETSAVRTSSPLVQQAVEQRVRETVTPEMLAHFGLIVYVSKADVGPWAQRMYVFQKAGDDLLLLYDWTVSTGRETVEAAANGAELPTTTPSGYYQLDPKRFYEKYRSTQWNEPMPYAMFFNWINHGVTTGLAIHGTSEKDQALLGTRASAGCVRLATENSRTLFNLIRNNYKGVAPKFAFDKYSNTLMNNGLLVHDQSGNVALASGYSVLVYIDEFGGPALEAQAY